MNNPQPKAHWFSRLQRSSWGLTIVALGSVIIALAALTKAIDELLIFAGAKNTEQQNEQMIARDNERARFSRDLTRAMYQRLAAMKRYFSTVEAGYSRPDQDQAWDHYATGFREWNAGLMVNVLALERFYKGTTKRHLFENSIQVTFGRRLHACLEGLRRPQTTIECKLSPTRDIRVIGEEMERLDQDLYCFVVGLSEKEDPPCFLKLWTPYKPTRG